MHPYTPSSLPPSSVAPGQSRAPKLVFIFGNLLLWGTMIASEFAAPGGIKRGSPFDAIEGPLFILSAVICTLAPVFSQRPLARKLLLILLACVAWVLSLMLAGIASICVFGLPID